MPFSFSFFLFFLAEGVDGFGVFNFRNLQTRDSPTPDVRSSTTDQPRSGPIIFSVYQNFTRPSRQTFKTTTNSLYTMTATIISSCERIKGRQILWLGV